MLVLIGADTFFVCNRKFVRKSRGLHSLLRVTTLYLIVLELNTYLLKFLSAACKLELNLERSQRFCCQLNAHIKELRGFSTAIESPESLNHLTLIFFKTFIFMSSVKISDLQAFILIRERSDSYLNGK